MELTIPALLYSEVHFKFFKSFPSLLFQNEPEILFDAPKRAPAGSEIPILLILNDLRKYPVHINEVTIALQIDGYNSHVSFINFHNYEINHKFNKNQKAYIFPIAAPSVEGFLNIDCKIDFVTNGKKKLAINDNLKKSSKTSLSCYIAKNTFPGAAYCKYGDLHIHSQYSQSHVEFGPPIQVINTLAKSYGLDFIAITDHSYDLACLMTNYLIEDPKVERWKNYLDDMNADELQIINLPGEEISCLNSEKNVVHLCGINISEFIPGSMDGARRKKVHSTQSTINQAVTNIHLQNGLAVAAHPGSRKSLIQKIFLNRGYWSEKDIIENSLDGIQAFNGSFKGVWERGKALWLFAIQNGKRLALLAGNDAHGDFNRYRAIKIPFFSIYEDFQRFMGFGKTGVYTSECDKESIVKAIEQAKTFITTGPFLSINYTDNPGDSAISNIPLSKSISYLYIHAFSTPEFGPISDLKIFAFYEDERVEKLLLRIKPENQLFRLCNKILFDQSHPLYIRAEVKTKNNFYSYEAFTSACYFNQE
jgi:predicted metal-dependent phosphoesterase TrpH